MERQLLYVDVRRPDEFITGHIPGALNVNMEDEMDFIETMRRLADEHDIVIYCQSGFRASYAQSLLETKYNIVVTNLDGGIMLYQGPLEVLSVSNEE
jgi:phage shock protein E